MPAPSSVAADGELDALLTDYRANVGAVWNRRADGIYDRWHRERGDFDALAAALPRPLGAVLDLGFGYGRAWPVYAHARRVVGVDVSARMLELARTHLGDEAAVEMVCTSVRALPFPDASFDVALSIRTLNHVHPDELPTALAEARRVARRFVLLEAREVRVDPRLEFAHDYLAALRGAGFTAITSTPLPDADLHVAV